MEITLLDYLVFFIFVGGVALFGCSFYFRSRKGAAAFTAAEGSLPTWVVGMSIFATFVSSISFLGLPGDAYKGNWNPFVFSLSIPIATWLAAKVFIPLYRGIDSVSAYHYLEMRFGYWARCYVAVCYLLTQLARVGSILLLLALPLNTMFAWDIQTIIVCTGIATLIYTLLGGIAAVVWTDAIQGIILIVGAIACAAILTFTMPEGPGQLFEIASAHGKFSLGSFGASLTEPTFWVVLIYGLFVNMQNYGIDQNYVQRYMTTRSTAEAVKSTLFGGLLYIPVSLVFVYIGTALFSYYTARPELLPAGTPSDQVFPWFIVHGLPTGLTGLVIASLFSAGMSTIATSINSSATIVLTDFAKRLSKKELSEKKSMRVLYATSFVVGALGIVMGLLMMRIDGVLDAWWKLASIFSGGMLGLFLLGVVCKTVRRAHAVVAVILGLLTIAWMSLSPLINAGSPFYRFHSPLHTYLTIVFGTTVIFLTGFLLTKLTKRKIESKFHPIMKNSHPKIGIRPIIDGRRGGIRESLEEMTMGMALSVAKLYAAKLRYADGAPVECVIADTTIGGVAEAAAATDKFRDNNVGAVLSVTPCWCYGSETIDMDPLMPKAIWGFNKTQRPGAVYLASALAGHNQKGLPAFGIYGSEVQEQDDNSITPDVEEKLLRFGRAAVAVMEMHGKSYLSIGSVSMGIAGSMPDPDFFQEYLGMRNEAVDCSEIARRIELGIYDKEEFERAMAWVEKHCKTHEGEDLNPEHLRYSREKKDEVWEYVVKMTMIFRDLMVGNPKLAEMGFEEEAAGHNAIAGGFQGQRQWTDFRPDGDFSEAILNTSFDWNGIREAYTFATENDTLNGVSMLFMHLLTNQAQLFSDVRTYWSPEAVERATGRKLTGKAANGIIHLINSGSSTLDASGAMSDAEGNPVMKPFWEITEQEAERCLEATTWHPAGREYMRGGGFSSKFFTRGDMPVTMCRLNLIKGQGPVLQIAEGWAVNVDRAIFEHIDKRTDPSWPTTYFAPRLTGKGAFKSVYNVMNNWGANHGAITYGHVGADLITLASMLRIPVCMHNVDEEKIFRPSAWSAFGSDPEGSDYRACKNYGPIYK